MSSAVPHANELHSPRSMFLIYHELGTEAQSYSYYCGAEQFDQHLQLAVDLRHSTGRHIYQPEITFDDGHLSQHSHALPLLERHGIRATFFVTAGWIGTRENYMSWQNLRELRELGHQVQSHTWSHPMLTHCSDSELEKELLHSRKEIEGNVGAPVDAISIPNGRWNDRILRACVAAGYARVFTSDSWKGEESRRGARILGRINVPQSMTADRLKALACNSGTKRMHDTLSYSKHLLKRLAGDRIYHHLWRMVAHADDAT